MTGAALAVLGVLGGTGKDWRGLGGELGQDWENTGGNWERVRGLKETGGLTGGTGRNPHGSWPCICSTVGAGGGNWVNWEDWEG